MPLLALMAAGALVETTGLIALVPLIALASGDVSWPAIIPFADPFGGLEVGERVIATALLFLALMAVRAWLLFLRDRRYAAFVVHYGASLRARFVSSISSRGWKRADTLGESGFQRALIGDAARVTHAAEQGLGLISAFLLLVIQGAAALFLSPGLTLIALTFFVVGIALAIPRLRTSGQRGLTIASALDDAAEESGRFFQALKVAMAEGTTDGFLRAYRERNVSLATAESDLAVRQAKARAFANLFVALGAVALLLAGLMLFDLPFAVLIPLIVIFARLSGPARQGFFAFEQAIVYSASFSAFRDLQDRADNTPDDDLSSDWNELRLDQVRARVSDSLEIGPCDLALRRGEWVGLAGPSGSGKSVIIDVIAGLNRPDSGRILLDGEPVSLHRNAGWAAGLAYVGQNMPLWDGDLASNLQSAVVDERIIEATGLLGIADRLGYSTELGRRGDLLSGGEAQRVSIARALHRNPALLIIDEGTAALDLDAEKQLFARVRELAPGMAVVLVAHRPDSLRHADRIYTIG